jgi:nucleotidyltransferase substrate binding protein (TIGR01987 family)
MELQFIARFEKYQDSLSSLEKIKKIDWPKDENLYGFIWCGVISKFCITFDLSFKLIKDILVEYHGITNFAKGSPREILREGFQAGIINSDTWLIMLKARNEIVHEYKDYDHVDDWCKKIVNDYLPLFEGLSLYTKEILK